jgi:uncharacterized membrane protein YphA (DoxX/SURF4 family)
MTNLLATWGPRVGRILLGLAFTVFGLNYFFDFLPAQPPPDPKALPFLGGLVASEYVFPLIKAIEVAAGLALLANLFVPLALVLLAPIIVNIVAFHALLSPGLPVPLAILALELYLAWSYRDAFKPMLRAHTAPAAAASAAATAPQSPPAAAHRVA